MMNDTPQDDAAALVRALDDLRKRIDATEQRVKELESMVAADRYRTYSETHAVLHPAPRCGT